MSEQIGGGGEWTALRELVAKFSDLAVEIEKHSNDHIHDAIPDNLQAAVEGVCADRINAILKQYRDGLGVAELRGMLEAACVLAELDEVPAKVTVLRWRAALEGK